MPTTSAMNVAEDATRSPVREVGRQVGRRGRAGGSWRRAAPGHPRSRSTRPIAVVRRAAPSAGPTAVRVADHGDQAAGLGGQRVGDRGDVLELALDRVRRRVARRATTATVHRVDGRNGEPVAARRPERRVVRGRAVDQEERRPGAARGRPRSACRRPTETRSVGLGSVIRAAAAGGGRASSRIQVAAGRRASWAGQRSAGSALGPEDITARIAALLSPVATTISARRGADDGRVQGDPLDVRLDVGRGRDGQRQVVGVEGRRAREDRQQVAVAPDAEEHEVEDRPAVVAAAGPTARSSSRERGRTPVAAPGGRRSPRPPGTGGGGRTAGTRPASRRRPSLPRPARCPRRMSSNGLTLDSGWSRGTKRSSPHQTWTAAHGTSARQGRLGERAVDPGDGRAAGRRPVRSTPLASAAASALRDPSAAGLGDGGGRVRDDHDRRVG